eukprot:COSAG04_NODE_502_length_13354_cov_548.289777_20_plen_227_part_01
MQARLFLGCLWLCCGVARAQLGAGYCDGRGGLQPSSRPGGDPSCRGSCRGCSAAQVLAAMAFAPGIHYVQTNALSTLGTLAYEGPATRAVVVAAGGIEAVTGAMTRFPDNSDVQGSGCYVLRWLSGGASERGTQPRYFNRTNAAAIGAAGGHALASAALVAHSELSEDHNLRLYCQIVVEVVPADETEPGPDIDLGAGYCDGRGGLQPSSRPGGDPSCRGSCRGCSA